MLISSVFLIISISTLIAVILINPLILFTGFANLLKRQKKSLFASRKTERKILAYHQKSIEKMEKQLQAEVRSELATLAAKHSQALARLGGRQEIKLTLAGVVARTEKRVDEELNQELAKARAEINAYREKRIKRVDDEITALVEKTIYLTLGKGLSLKNQIDIIYESLAEAKEEGFFGKNAG